MTEERPLRFLGRMLLDGAFIDPSRLHEAEEKTAQIGIPLQRVLVQGDFGVTPETVATLLSFQLERPLVDIALFRVPPGQKPVELIDGAFARERHVLPVIVSDDGVTRSLLLAMEDPTDAETIAEVQRQIGILVEPVISLRNLYEQIEAAYPINPA